MSGKLVGRTPPRKEGLAKVRGEAKYVDDLHFDGMIYGTTVRSSVPRGRLKNIVFKPGVPWEQFTIMKAADIPGKNVVALLTEDQPFLVEKNINHPEEPVVLLAHPDPYLLEEARRHVELEVEPLPAVLSIEESEAQKQIIWGADNVLKSYLLTKGDVDAVFARPDVVIVEGEYRTGAQEQLYIETNGVIATASQDAGVTVWGSIQCPYYVQKALISLFGWGPDKVRVVQAETGGGFGGKEEYPSIIAGHAALLALKARKPVKMIYDRAEDMVATTKRHPSRTRHRSAVSPSGELLALDIDFVIDGGAYNTLSPVVLSRGTIHAAGPYKCDNVRIRAAAVATNTPPHGAFRGFGAPQSLFALERHVNRLAAAVSLTPEEFRRRNFLKKGELTATGQEIQENIDLPALMAKGLALADADKKRALYKKENPQSRVKRGVGFATFLHGAGFTGSGESYLASVVGAELTPQGRVRVLAASTEIGQGTNTIFSQIAADALGLPYELIEVAQPDTANVPNSGPTVASRTCMIVGKLVESAVHGVRETLQRAGLLNATYSAAEWTTAAQNYLQAHGKLQCYSQYKAPPGVVWDDKNYRGVAYGAYAWATYVAQVAVDTVTFETRVEDFVALQEVGKVIHPLLAAGQIEGGVAQGIGYAIYEKVVWKDGRMANGQMTNYIMPTAADLGTIRVFFEEDPYAYGPFGAKGIGELPMDGPGPAILNAIEDAIGVSHNEIPMLPEDLFEAVSRAGAVSKAS